MDKMDKSNCLIYVCVIILGICLLKKEKEIQKTRKQLETLERELEDSE
jgi:hypothetical protein